MKKQNTEIETNNLLVGSFAALPRKILKVIKKKKKKLGEHICHFEFLAKRGHASYKQNRSV